MKKILALMLSVMMVVCMMPSMAFAETTAEQDPASPQYTLNDYTKTFEYNGSIRVPNIVVYNNGAVVDAATYTIKYTKTSTDSTTITEPKDAGKYEFNVTLNSSENETDSNVIASGEFEIKPYDLSAHNVSATVDNQVSEFTTVDSGDIHYFSDGKERTDDFFSSNFNATVSNGVVSFNANTAGNFQGTIASVTPKTAPNINTCTVTSVNVTYDGNTKNPNTLVTVKNGSSTVSSANYEVTCSKEIKDKGTYSLTIKGKGAYAGSTTRTVEVTARGINYISVSSIPNQVEGKININPTITDSLNGKTVTLQPGSDYNITTPTFDKSLNASTDQYYVTINFIGNYTGEKKVTFNVAKSAYDISQVDASITSGSYSPMYNGKIQTPAIKVTANGTAFSSSYYCVEYRYTDAKNKTISTTSPVDAHNYLVYLVGRSPYAGEKFVGSFTIQPFNYNYINITASQSSIASAPNITVKSLDGAITFVKDKDYTVGTPWVSTATGKGYVTVTSNGSGNLTSGSTQVTYSLVTKNIYGCSVAFASGSYASYNYTGSSITPQVTVRDGYVTLVKDTDYTITYKNAAGTVVASPRDAGTYTIEIAGKGAYSGTTTLTFTINGTDISRYTVSLKEYSVTADGMRKYPSITSVTYGINKLSSADYTVSYEDASGKTVTSLSAPGTYKIVVTGKNGYSGKTYANFSIVGKTQSITTNYTYYTKYLTSSAFNLGAKTDGDGVIVYESSDPSVATVSSTGTVTVHGTGIAYITVKTTKDVKYNPASKVVTVTVKPKKPAFKVTSPAKGQVKVTITKVDGATKYQVRYGRMGSYSNRYITHNDNGYSTTYVTLKNLKPGTNYFVKVRSYKKLADGTIVWGNWTVIKKIKTK